MDATMLQMPGEKRSKAVLTNSTRQPHEMPKFSTSSSSSSSSDSSSVIIVGSAPVVIAFDIVVRVS